MPYVRQTPATVNPPSSSTADPGSTYIEEYELLKIRDLPDITVGDWQRAPEGTAENPALVNDDDDIESTIEVDNNEEGLLYTAREVEEGVTIKEEREEDVITDSGVESEERFDLDSESDFDDDIDGDKDMDDENM